MAILQQNNVTKGFHFFSYFHETSTKIRNYKLEPVKEVCNLSQCLQDGYSSHAWQLYSMVLLILGVYTFKNVYENFGFFIMCSSVYIHSRIVFHFHFIVISANYGTMIEKYFLQETQELNRDFPPDRPM